ncbi:MAG: anti-sigma factor [Betaproteobacteria bacterium]|nr:anti-sigma factor [Betaproteobacteria bacterium]
MKLAHPELRNRIAAEYVLGTLRGGARRRFVEMMSADSGLRAEVERWESHLMPLADRLAPVEAPARVWKKIQARIGPSRQTETGWWTRATVGLASFAAALVLAVALVPYLQRGEEAPVLTAVLEDMGVARMIVEQPKSGLLTVRMVKAWKAAPDNSLELWVIAADGSPRSLGLINNANGDTQLRTAELEQKLAGGLTFALTKEPKGGSSTGQPTGPVLCKGAIARAPVKVRTQI